MQASENSVTAIPEPPSTVDDVRRLAALMLAENPGALRLADAMLRVAAEVAVPVAGRPSTAAWLERMAHSVRRGDV